jgi:XRE family transcriptional regulator, regulator of sulfur utilization
MPGQAGKVSDETLRRSFGSVLRLFRQAKGLTQQQLADASGTSINQIYNLEVGRQSPTLVKLWDLCLALDIPPRVLIAEVEQELVQDEVADSASPQSTPSPPTGM